MSSISTTVPKKRAFPSRQTKKQLISFYCPANQGERSFRDKVNKILRRLNNTVGAHKKHYIERTELIVIIDELGLPDKYTYADITWFPASKI
jgi:hypothetical protein